MDDVNKAITKCIDKIRDLERNQSQIHFAISILQFSDSCDWYGGVLSTSIDDFEFVPLEPTGVFTNFEKVCIKLDSSLNNSGFFDESNLYKNPFMLLISDGECRKNRYDSCLQELYRNRFFKKSIRYAVGADDEGNLASKEMLEDFTGNPENVKKVDAVEGELAKLIENLTITFSKMSIGMHTKGLSRLGVKE